MLFAVLLGEFALTDNRSDWVRKAGLASSIGIMFVGSTLLGAAFGWWLDKKLGTSPWLMLVFTLLGTAGGFIEMVKIAKEISKDD
jgi:ATP synthase protein I